MPGRVEFGAASATGVCMVVRMLGLPDGNGEPARGVLRTACIPLVLPLVELVVEEQGDETGEPHGQQQAVYHRHVACKMLDEGAGGDVAERVQVAEGVQLRGAQGGVKSAEGVRVEAVVLRIRHPADDCIKHTLPCRRVWVARAVAVLVVASVHDRPPEWIALERQAGHDSQHKLENARRPERAVRKVAVQAHRHRNANAQHRVQPRRQHVCHAGRAVAQHAEGDDARHGHRRHDVVRAGRYPLQRHGIGSHAAPCRHCGCGHDRSIYVRMLLRDVGCTGGRAASTA